MRIFCPGCRKHYYIDKLEKNIVKCWTCGVLYFQAECTEGSTILDNIIDKKR
jgi:ribosomal protein S27E